MTDSNLALASLDYSDLARHEEPLGRGKFGIVYKAHCEKLNEDVAVKIISDRKIYNQDEIKTLLMGTPHHNVINIKAVISPKEEKDKYWIVMEFCDYSLQQIRDKIAESPIPWPRWASFMRDILAGLKYLHENNIVHCDLKPENVLVNNRFEAKIADAGLSRTAGLPYVESEDTDRQLVAPSGTLQYMSPERLGNPYKAPHCSDDYYSCSLLFYKMITNGDLFYLSNGYDEEAQISLMKRWLCAQNYRHPLENLTKFGTPQEISLAISILWDVNHKNRNADEAQKKLTEAITKHGYDRKETLEQADKDLKNLMDGILPVEQMDGVRPVEHQRDEVDFAPEDLSIFFDDIAQLDGISNWKKFARQGLRLTTSELQEIEEDYRKFHEQKVAMLQKWQDREGLKATVDLLEKALLGCKFKLAAQKLRKIEGLSSVKSNKKF